MIFADSAATYSLSFYFAWLGLDSVSLTACQDWMNSLLPHLTLQSTSTEPPNSKASFTFVVKPEHCNRLNNLHGVCLSIPLLPNSWQTCPSPTLCLSFP